MHTWDDALLWCTLPMAENPEISDLAHVILNHLGV
jgi:hypothetical protein